MSESDQDPQHGVELPAPTVWPIVLSLGLLMIGAGLVFSLAFVAVGAVLFLAGLGGWIAQLLPGRGHVHEPRAEQPHPIQAAPGAVEQLRPGMAGYRLRLPEKVHPISAGIKGGIVGGVVMIVPALAYGILSGHGIWFPVNLLAGMVLPGMETLSTAELVQFRLSWFLIAIAVHAVVSLVFGLLYGVMLPTMPAIPGGPIVWAGVVMPLLWTLALHGLIGIINPVLEQHVQWLPFMLSQVIFGVSAAIVVMRSEKVHIPPAGTGPEEGTP